MLTDMTISSNFLTISIKMHKIRYHFQLFPPILFKTVIFMHSLCYLVTLLFCYLVTLFRVFPFTF